jgi:hypothetical protein
MFKLRVKDRRRLEKILDYLDRGAAYLKKDNIKICGTQGPGRGLESTDYFHRNGHSLTPFNKVYGSDLAMLWTAIGMLREELTPQEEETE